LTQNVKHLKPEESIKNNQKMPQRLRSH